MKFYRIETDHTQLEIDKIIFKFTLSESEEIDKIFKNLNVVEFTDERRKESLFAVLNETDLEKIKNIYIKYHINYSVTDLTKEVLFDIPFNVRYKDSYMRNVSLKIRKMIKDYKKNWTTTDVVLDKILELGIESLTDFDYSVLKSH
jgi:hypothetical protein